MRRLVLAVAIIALALGLARPTPAEYGDVVLNRYSENGGVRAVIFPHWFHRIRFRCKVCHFELGFEMRAGANDVTMNDMAAGRFCGMCHDDKTAWGLQNCDLCHTGRPGVPIGIHGGDSTVGPGRW